jgi:hypothetical protein
MNISIILLSTRSTPTDSCKRVLKMDNLTLDEQGGTNCPPIDKWDRAMLKPIF